METLQILQQREFRILAAAAGISELYGMGGGEPLSQQEVMYGLHELVQRGVLAGDGQEFMFCEPFRTIFHALKDADRLLVVTGRGQDMQDFCIYQGEKPVLLEESRQDADAVRVGVYEPEALYELLEERGFLPRAYVPMDIALLQKEEELTEALTKQTRAYLEKSLQADLPEEAEEQIIARYLLYDLKREQKREPFKAFYLLENPCNYWIAEKDAQTLSYLQYDQQTLYEKILASLR